MIITKEYVQQNIELFITNKEEFWRDATEIAPNAFYDVDSVKRKDDAKGEYFFRSIVIPDSIKSIGAHAFEDCDYLEEVVLPKNLKQISEECFKYCPSLKRIDLPEGLEEVGEQAFYEARLEKINFPTSLKKIGKKSFVGNDFTTLVFNEGLQTISNGAFERCSRLVDIKFSSSIKSIQKRAFLDCFALRKIIIPQNVESVDAEAFYNCDNLSSVVCENKQTNLGKQCFSYTNIACVIEKDNGLYFLDSCQITENDNCRVIEANEDLANLIFRDND